MKLSNIQTKTRIRMSATTDIDLVVGEIFYDEKENKYFAVCKNLIMGEIYADEFVLTKRLLRMTSNKDGSHDIINIE